MRPRAYLAGIRASGELAQLMDRYYGHSATFDYAGTRKFMRDYQSCCRATGSVRGRRQARGHRLAADRRRRLPGEPLEPGADSPKGAPGMMMLTPTPRADEYRGPQDAVQSITAGSKYLWRMQAHREARAGHPRPDLTWMALAGYNMGLAICSTRARSPDQRRQPGPLGGCKHALPLLMERRWYTQARWGYARGRETRAYVRNIRNYYDILVWLRKARRITGAAQPGNRR